MVHLLEVTVIAGAVILITFMILLALPQCRIRDMLMPFIRWAFVVICAAYALSPVDLLPELALGPFGVFDDLAVGIAGVATAVSAINAAKLKRAATHDAELN